MDNPDLGSYNATRRQQEIKGSLETSFEELRQIWLDQNKRCDRVNSNKTGRDSVMMLISEISDEVASLSSDVDVYPGPHFVQLYRTLNEKCARFQLRLDKIDTAGKINAKEERKKVLIAADAAAKKLATKVHPDGKLCPECELKQL